MGWVMFSIVQDISHIDQQGDCGLYFGSNSPQSPGDIVSFDFFSIANSFSWWYWKLVNCRKEHTKKHKYQKTQVPVVQVWKNLEIKNNRRQVRPSAGFGFPKSFELSVISHIQNMYVRSALLSELLQETLGTKACDGDPADSVADSVRNLADSGRDVHKFNTCFFACPVQ